MMGSKNDQSANAVTITKLMFRLLPVQCLLAAVGMVNSIISGYFASNFIGMEAMAAVGLWSPVNMLIGAVSTMLVGGSVILCGQFLSRNESERFQQTFSLGMMIAFLTGAVFNLLLVFLGLYGLTGIFTNDESVRQLFDRYLLGEAFTVIPYICGNMLTAFLSLENRGRRITVAGILSIIATLFFNIFFVLRLSLGVTGLALAQVLGLCVFLFVQAEYFFSGKSQCRLSPGSVIWREAGEIIRIGYPGAASYGYQTLRGLILNYLAQAYVGSVGLSAMAASNNLLYLFWAVPTGMLAVSRMMISVSIGEEDRQTLADVMRVMFRRYVPMMSLISLMIILLAEPLTGIYFHDPSSEIYRLTLLGVRIIPLCMPLSVILMHFVCYGQSSGKPVLVNLLSFEDGVLFVAGFAAMLIGTFGMGGIYAASVINGIMTTVTIVLYAWIRKGHFPRNMEELMVIPDDFGALPEDRMDLSIRSLKEVVRISERVQAFCLERGIDEKRSFLSALALEEMAGNVVNHGFAKDRKKHSVDIRVVRKEEDVILRIRDDCVPFDPDERRKMTDPEDPVKNFGIRTVYQIAREINYQNILGMNVLTIRV